MAEQELSALASDMGGRMESVSRDIKRQIERIAGPEFRQFMAMDDKGKKAAMEALQDRLKAQIGENASFLKSLQFTPAATQLFPLPKPRGRQAKMNGKIPGDIPDDIVIIFPGETPMQGTGNPENNGWLPPPPSSRGRFNTEVRNGNELVGKISAEISSQRLLRHVLMRTQSRQHEIPFAIDSKGELYATNTNDMKQIQALAIPRPGNEGGTQQKVTTTNNWILLTQKDSYSDLTFGIARPIDDRLGELRRTTVRNMGYGLAVVALALVGIIPLSSKMTRNLTVLTKEAEKLAQGDLTARVQVASKDEFGKLSQAFNHMAQEISANQINLIKQERMQKELEMCRKIQEEFLPRQTLRSGAIEVKGISIPAREVGGDFFNYFPMPDKAMGLLIGDVSGKGLPAALLMANLQASIQARLPLELDLVKLAEQLDNEIAVNNEEAYLTLFIAVLDTQSLELRYVNAGHNSQFLLRSDGSAEQLQSTGRPLGLLAGGGFQEKTVSLKNQDSLFFYTDGLVETVNETGEEFGMERLEALLVDERTRGFEGMLINVENAINKYREGREVADDATMMLLKIDELT